MTTMRVASTPTPLAAPTFARRLTSTAAISSKLAASAAASCPRGSLPLPAARLPRPTPPLPPLPRATSRLPKYAGRRPATCARITIIAAVVTITTRMVPLALSEGATSVSRHLSTLMIWPCSLLAVTTNMIRTTNMITNAAKDLAARAALLMPPSKLDFPRKA